MTSDDKGGGGVNNLEKMSDIILMWKAPRILYFLLFVFLLLNYISKSCC